jgi:hypothetical protein
LFNLLETLLQSCWGFDCCFKTELLFQWKKETVSPSAFLATVIGTPSLTSQKKVALELEVDSAKEGVAPKTIVLATMSGDKCLMFIGKLLGSNFWVNATKVNLK